MKNDSRNGKNRRRNSNRIHWKYSNGRHEDVYANFEGEKVKASVADFDGDGVQVSVECKEKGKEILRYWFCLPDVDDFKVGKKVAEAIIRQYETN